MADVAAHLVRNGLLSPEGASRALAAAGDGDVASAALRLGLAAERDLVRALCDLHGCPGVDLSRSTIPVANLDVVASAFCRQRRVLPVSVGKGEMVLAMADPEDYALADELRFVTGRKILRYAAVPAAIERALDGLSRERRRAAPAWRGPDAPSLSDPAAAWVGVVHPTRRAPEEAIELPEITSTMEIVGVAESLETPFAAPSPARRSRPPEHQPPPPPDDGSAETTARLEGVGAGKLVLVAEASQEGREETAAVLERLGCTVLQVANGRSALELTRAARPDLVVLEAMLPMAPGYEVCRAVKGDPVLRSTLVVLTSAVQRGAMAADAKAAFGADAFLERPLRAEEATRVFKNLLLGPAGELADGAAREEAAAAWREGARLLREGRVEEAEAVLRQAVAKDEFAAEAHYYLGHALVRQGLLFEAAAAYSRAAELRPDVDAAHQLLAQAYEQLGFQKSAREAWARGIEVCQDDGRRRAMQARLVKLLGL